MYSCHKNSYLQGNYPDINAGLLNRSVQKAWDGITNIDEHDFSPPFNRLTSEQPNIPVENVDPTRRPQGYGRWAMPKLGKVKMYKIQELLFSSTRTVQKPVFFDCKVVDLEKMRRLTTNSFVHKKVTMQKTSFNSITCLKTCDNDVNCRSFEAHPDAYAIFGTCALTVADSSLLVDCRACALAAAHTKLLPVTSYMTLQPFCRQRRELHNKNLDVVIAALTSISDLVHDPERCYEAIRLNIVDRISDNKGLSSVCLEVAKTSEHKIIKTNRLTDLICHETPEVRERAVHTLQVIAGVAMGKEAIVNNETLVINLLDKVEDEYSEVRIQVAACLEKVASFWKAADVLVEAGFIQVLLTNVFDDEEIVEYHLETLKSLLYCDGKKIAIEEDAFQILIQLFDRPEGAILSKTCEILVRLCMIKEGRKLAKEFNLLPEFNRLLHDERVEVHAAAAQAIMFCTIKSSEKIAASKLKNMPKRLVQLSKNKLNYMAQMYAIKDGRNTGMARSIDLVPGTEGVDANGMALAQRLLEDSTPPAYRLIEIQPMVQTGRNPHRWQCRYERLDNVYRFDFPYLTELRTAFRRLVPLGCDLSQVVLTVCPSRQFITVEYMALTCICEHPAVRKEVTEKYYNDVKAIQVRDDIPEIRQCKNILMCMLQWTPYSN